MFKVQSLMFKVQSLKFKGAEARHCISLFSFSHFLIFFLLPFPFSMPQALRLFTKKIPGKDNN
jgi:hypothetical protein